MTESDQSVLLRHASLILALVNVLQPVAHEVLAQHVGADKEAELTGSLRFLIRQRYVRALPGRFYRTTWLGQNALWSRVLTKKRDIQRMWYLSELSDRIRRGEAGGDS